MTEKQAANIFFFVGSWTIVRLFGLDRAEQTEGRFLKKAWLSVEGPPEKRLAELLIALEKAEHERDPKKTDSLAKFGAFVIDLIGDETSHRAEACLGSDIIF